MIKSFLRHFLERLTLFHSGEFRITAYDIVRETPRLKGATSPLTLYLDWRHEQIRRFGLRPDVAHPDSAWLFESYYGKVDRMSLLASFLKSVLAIPGEVAEFGVFRGGSALLMDQVLAEGAAAKKLYLFDSFEGMPEVTHPLDRSWRKGDLANPVENVRELFKDSPRVVVVPGFFADTFSLHDDLRFAFCHVDCDLYSSINECIAYIMPRLSEGGSILFDDYGFRDCPGAKLAIQERFDEIGRSFVPLPTGQAVYLHRGLPSDVPLSIVQRLGRPVGGRLEGDEHFVSEAKAQARAGW